MSCVHKVFSVRTRLSLEVQQNNVFSFLGSIYLVYRTIYLFNTTIVFLTYKNIFKYIFKQFQKRRRFPIWPVCTRCIYVHE